MSLVLIAQAQPMESVSPGKKENYFSKACPIGLNELFAELSKENVAFLCSWF
jgi:hypothetical protein